MGITLLYWYQKMKEVKKIENKAKNWDEFTDVIVVPELRERPELEQKIQLYDDFTKSKDKIARTILHQKEMTWIFPLECLKNHFKIKGHNLSILSKDLNTFYDMKLSEEGKGFEKLFTSVQIEKYREQFLPQTQTSEFIDKIKKVKGKIRIR